MGNETGVLRGPVSMLKVPTLGSLAGRRILCLTPKPESPAELLMGQKPPALDYCWAVRSAGILGIPLQSDMRDKENPRMWRSSWRKKLISGGSPQPITPMGAKWMTFCRWEEEIPDPRSLEGFGIS